MTTATWNMAKMTTDELNVAAKSLKRQVINAQYRTPECDQLVAERSAVLAKINLRYEAAQS